MSEYSCAVIEYSHPLEYDIFIYMGLVLRYMRVSEYRKGGFSKRYKYCSEITIIDECIFIRVVTGDLLPACLM